MYRLFFVRLQDTNVRRDTLLLASQGDKKKQ